MADLQPGDDDFLRKLPVKEVFFDLPPAQRERLVRLQSARLIRVRAMSADWAEITLTELGRTVLGALR
jgi:hypothetical protein